MIEEVERLLALVLKEDSLSPVRAESAGSTRLTKTIHDTAFEDAILDAAHDHDVDVLVRHLSRARGGWPLLSARLRAALDTRARNESVLNILRSRELGRVLHRLRDARLPVFVIKGAAIAHTHYPAPYLRPRYDTDLLVRKDDFARAGLTLVEMGYRRVNSVSREAVRTQWTFERRLAGGIPEYIDLHWAISNRPLFADMLTFDELLTDAVAIKSHVTDALEFDTPGPVHALLLACIHRVAHHNGWPKLIWLYDMKLLADGLSALEWRRFHELASVKQIGSLCREALTTTSATVGLSSQAKIAMIGSHSRTAEPSAAYLGSVGTRWRSLALDLLSAPGLLAKLRLVVGHAFPDTAYMRAAYGTSGTVGLATAYLRRVVVGVWHLTWPVTRQA
jgi:hypothetical protein